MYFAEPSNHRADSNPPELDRSCEDAVSFKEIPVPLMRRARGSTRRNALSSDLKPGARCGGAADRQAGGVATSAPQPQPQPLHHTTILIFQQPRALTNSSDCPQNWHEYRARLVRQTPSESGRSRALIPLNHTKTGLGRLKSQDSQGARGPFGLKQTTPPTGLSAPKLPLPRRAAPDVVRCVARPRRVHIEIVRDRPIGRSEWSQNWWAGSLE